MILLSMVMPHLMERAIIMATSMVMLPSMIQATICLPFMAMLLSILPHQIRLVAR